MKSGIIFSDTHLESITPIHPSYALVKKFATEFKPDFAVHLGDALHLDYFSGFEEGNVVEGNWEEDVALLNKELDFWQGLVGENLSFIQGNHDFRAERAAQKVANLALRESLSYERRLNIKQRKIKYVKVTDDPLKLGKLYMCHGYYWNKYHAFTHLEKFSGNIIYGHVHANQQAHKVLAARDEDIEAWSIGCLCDKAPDYLRGRPSGWQHSFAIMYLQDNGNFNLYTVNIVKNSFVWGGIIYA